MPLHNLMIGTWTPPGAIFTVQFDDEALTLTLVKRTEIPHDEPISWMSFDVRIQSPSFCAVSNIQQLTRR
jgi:carboxy-cis,cis-muconate cyclase